MKKKEEQLQISLDRVKLQKHVYELCRVQKLTINEVRKKTGLVNPAKRNVLDLKNETCKNREKRNVLKISHTRHFKTTKKQSKTGCFYSF
ncbi:hypothetical protein DW060_00415 [Leyella stercorea]|uniref:Uncharacterized protein n=1 Tax=Leyella stercorea TaxID=363265 RepID=A0A3R6IX21_9BACT|nr:hypothetical protein DW060_00415 [Leyella stercorea]